jgi:hypothetical protein
MQFITELEKRLAREMLLRISIETGEMLNSAVTKHTEDELRQIDERQKALKSLQEKVMAVPVYDQTGEFQIVDFAEDIGLRGKIHRDLTNALTGIASKYGVMLRYNTMRYLNKGFGMKLECMVPAASPLELAANLRPGDQFKRKGTFFWVEAISHESKTVSARTTRGKRYRVTFAQLAEMIKIKPFNMGKQAFDAVSANVAKLIWNDTEELDFANLPMGEDNVGKLFVEGGDKRVVTLANGKKVNLDDIETI